MAECILMKSGSSADLDVVTAGTGDVLAGKVIVDKDGDPISGTMPNKGAWTSRIGVNGKAVIPAGYHNGAGYVDQAITNRGAVSAALGINGTYTIPEGYHNGAGKVTQNIATMGAQTVTPGNSQKVVSCSGKYMTGNVTVPAVSGLVAANIKKGVTVGGVTGTWEGYVAGNTDIYNRGVVGKYGLDFGNNTAQSNQISLAGGTLATTSAINLTPFSRLNVLIIRPSGNNGAYFSLGIPNDDTLFAKNARFTINTTETTITLPFNYHGTEKLVLRINADGFAYLCYVRRIWLS